MHIDTGFVKCDCDDLTEAAFQRSITSSDGYLGCDVCPGWLPGGHLYDRASHRPDVCCPADPLLVNDLGCHPMGRPLDALLDPTVCTAAHSALGTQERCL